MSFEFFRQILIFAGFLAEPARIRGNPQRILGGFDIDIRAKSGRLVEVVNPDGDLIAAFLQLFGNIEPERLAIRPGLRTGFHTVDISVRNVIRHDRHLGVFRHFVQIEILGQPDL
ncbi:hypothetical protein SDC9_129036 [bioreactor metagenome]|uniref:Uncharacterized protein n=1 Tax=bioreactor metagenome TaxID=1076179 RepID=A0A645CYP9_9ZZZZ